MHSTDLRSKICCMGSPMLRRYRVRRFYSLNNGARVLVTYYVTALSTEEAQRAVVDLGYGYNPSDIHEVTLMGGVPYTIQYAPEDEEVPDEPSRTG